MQGSAHDKQNPSLLKYSKIWKGHGDFVVTVWYTENCSREYHPSKSYPFLPFGREFQDPVAETTTMISVNKVPYKSLFGALN